MAESNATQVILTDDGIKIINAQNTADNAASQAENANSAVSIAQSTANAAKSAADSTYAYANSEIAVQSTATAKAQSTADNAFSQAQAVGSQASAEINSNSTATAKAQSTADNAFSQATTAIDNGKVISQTVTDLKDGSKLTIADLENGLATKVANSDYASYKEQTAIQIGQMVSNSAFSAYQTTTADLIASKVATKDFSAYQATTAKSIDSKVSSSDFNTYKTQTADLIDDKVSSSQYSSDKTQTASEIADRVSNSAFSTYQTQTASQIASKVDNGDFSTYKTQTAGLIAQKVATSDFSAYQATTAKEISSKVESSDFNTYKTQTADSISSKVESSDFKAYQTQVNNSVVGTNLLIGTATPVSIKGTNSGNQALNTYALIGGMTAYALYQKYGSTFTLSYDWSVTDTANAYTGQMQQQFNQFPWGFSDVTTISSSNKSGHKVTTFTLANNSANTATGLQFRLDNVPTTSTITVSNMKLEKGNLATDWCLNPEDQATESQFTQLSNDINLRVTKEGLIDQINLQAGNTLISSSGQLTLSGKNIYFDTANPVTIPSANITGTLNGKTITGSVINGSTINGGTTSTNAYNVNKLAPLTIASDGTLTSTNYLNSLGAQAQIIDGELSTKYREFTPLSGTNYTAREVALGEGLLTLTDGYTTTADTGFNLTPIISGQTILSAEYGLQLYGPTQQIYFSGTDSTGVTGISLNSYGNIIGNTSATWWRVTSNAGSDVANFGIDSAGSNVIQFNRELDIGNFHINTGHTFASADNQAIHFAMGKGGAADIYAGAVHYTSLVKSSLLSVKKDVQKADTAYWAQLVNSIDLATYQYKSDDNTSHLRLSSIVDDVNDTKQWRLPDVFISRDEDGKLNGVDDSVLLNATLATVQEQQKEIDQLNGHLLELEAKLNG